MPSSHAQFVTFFSVSLTLFLLFRHKPTPPTSKVPSPWSVSYTHTTFIMRVLLSLVSLVCAGAVATSRIYLSYHTPKQVAVGVFFGFVIALGWFVVTSVARSTGLVDWFLDTNISRLFRLRDLVLEEDLQEGGWVRWEGKRKGKRVAGKKLR
jgi:dolichyldiphosphatase